MNDPIPKSAKGDWNSICNLLTPQEIEDIERWILNKFDEIATRDKKVSPSGWLASGFNWYEGKLGPLHANTSLLFTHLDEEEIQKRAGQFFGLFVANTLFKDSRTWFFVKDDKYQANGIPIKSRIYFLPE